MRKFSGDSIKINVDTGHNNAGNGGDGHSYGNFNPYNAKIDFDGENKIEKAHCGRRPPDQQGLGRPEPERGRRQWRRWRR